MPDSVPNWPAFVSLSVHELRTPANVVSGYVKMLLKGLGGTLTQPQREALLNADQSCERIAEILAEMSELARLEGGRLSLVSQRVGVADVLRQAEATLAANVAGCRVFPTADSMAIHVDRARLVRALVTLAAMVARHTESPTVEVRAERVGAQVVITVSNADTPASPAAAQPVTRLDEYMGGLGVALPLARLVVEGAGGQLGTPAGFAPGSAAAVIFPLASENTAA